jgi:anthranilate phosphoribosyltransferase
MGKEEQSRTDIVALNAGLVIYLRDKSKSIREGYELAIELIKNGKALEKLEDWVKYQNTETQKGLAVLDALKKRV